MALVGDNGIVSIECARSIGQTVVRLQQIVADRGLTVIALIDHGGEAARVGLDMPPTQLLIFGNALSGTPLMLAEPTVALDLPMKALAWQDLEGRVWISYNTPDYLQKRHGLSDELTGNIAGIASICQEAAG